VTIQERMGFIKQSLPFANISDEKLQWLADRVQEISIPAGTVIFKQHDQGDRSYLIRKGRVQIIFQDENGQEQQLAMLKPPVLFGEATLITHTPRNATALAVEDCDLLELKHEYLSELLESEDNVAATFMTLMVDRSRPLQNPLVTAHQRTAADGQELTILKNVETNSYFKLSNEGHYIWQQLDGKHTLQEITLKLAQEFDIFAPDVVVSLISKLTRAGFVLQVEMSDIVLGKQALWVRAMVKLQRLLDKRIAFGDADAWVSRVYANYIHYLFTRPMQWCLVLLALVGFIALVSKTNYILNFFAHEHASMLLVLLLIPLSALELLFHELGHAFAVKACGREVHYIGIGWTYSGPVAFTDTSDMWLAARKARMWVNIAGIYVDVVIAGLAGLLFFCIPNPYVQSMLWLFALYTYIGAFRMLSPLQEMDGYYLLMDWLEKDRLRHSAVIWLVKKFPSCIRKPSLFKENKAEVTYWLACVIYLILVSVLTLVIQKFVFIILGIHATNPYLSLILPLLVVLFSSMGIMADIKSQAEDS
jgi:CRP-like cAMP-binding protein